MKTILTSILTVLAIANMGASGRQVPKLVVCITVDQLRGDYLDYFYNTFGEQGFKRLLNEGVSYRNLSFSFTNIDRASAFATLFTGSNPCFHGISAEKRFDFYDNRELPALHDPDFLGNFTRDRFSPARLLASTIGDELKLASQGKSDVYAIAPEASQAILSAGHAANGAFWIDDINGKWATTTYYKSLPWYVDRYNNGPESLSARIGKTSWEPALPAERYNAFPYTTENRPFRHHFEERSRDCYPDFKTSGMVNAEVNNLALRFIEYAGFGSRSCPDMLAITYYAGSFSRKNSSDYTPEIQDTYCRLDRCLEQLFAAIDRKVGMSNVLIVFSGSGYFRSEEIIPQDMTLGGGLFYPKRCVALLNMYLMQLYGQKSWVNGYYDRQIFLNRKAAEEARIPLEEIQKQSAVFVAEFAGVQSVITDCDLRNGNWYEGNAALYKGTHHIGRGDLVVELQPGWRINSEEPGSTVELVRNNAVVTPLVFMGSGLKPQHLYREVKAEEVAPSVTYILRIRPPNASRQQPLHELAQR
ncbi:MAG: alkaline phosphatase family protein [Tannerellaceae bacterium]|jgi:hypothetical protein|nr:alkaline phosphatase family protein [Tannerellaceae bacterium]